ncbi:MAG TPA: hypothetical protein P5114_10535, partial [Hyphomicrobiaceae bacterium]|nr:hypothetical protein [Hyphomicrobiaceae bacterium]
IRLHRIGALALWFGRIFLGRTGIHFVGKCSTAGWLMAALRRGKGLNDLAAIAQIEGCSSSPIGLQVSTPTKALASLNRDLLR